eukprot:TRINITY_DN7734_c0_g1_i5.p1 TRINITY_DN7734_c0_g1~~TRINITY_DN7734_c0_g1_i5.p1  ORF type:complete len:353 (+),score=63.12 TRINITY_DN7734_c0_g1_i5:652-1710(+)
MEISIVGTEKVKEHKKDTLHVSYVIKVTTGPVSGHTWTVSRRYGRFQALHDEISLLFSEKVVPPLPASKWTRSFEKEYLDSQQSLLEQYLQALIKVEEIRNSHPFCQFLVSTLPEVLVSYNEDEQKKHRQILAEALLAGEQRHGLLQQIGRHQEQTLKLNQQINALQESLKLATEQWQQLERRDQARLARETSGKTAEMELEEVQSQLHKAREECKAIKQENEILKKAKEEADYKALEATQRGDRKSGSAGMPRPISYAVFCLKKKMEATQRGIILEKEMKDVEQKLVEKEKEKEQKKKEGYAGEPEACCSGRSEERFSRNAETDLVCRLLLEKKNGGNTARNYIRKRNERC